MSLITSGGGRRCRICGANHTACGPATTTTGVDERQEEQTMGALRRYKVTYNGTDTVMSLNEDDAKRLGGVPADSDQEPNEPEQESGLVTSTKARPTSGQNKARTTTENKAG